LAIATSAVREAENREELLGPLRNLAALEVRILTGPEEARLGAEAALSKLPMIDGTIVDLGGGSLELTRVRARRISSVASLPLGGTRLTKRFLLADPPAANEVRALRDTVRELLGACSASPAPGPLIALGGTVRALARLHVREGVLLREAALLSGVGKSIRHERASNRPPPPIGFEALRSEAR
jgi:exopolyphosphatase/guanosine-5'-triphosphate,3'-diphosphate pyrophosphatase